MVFLSNFMPAMWAFTLEGSWRFHKDMTTAGQQGQSILRLQMSPTNALAS